VVAMFDVYLSLCYSFKNKSPLIPLSEGELY